MYDFRRMFDPEYIPFMKQVGARARAYRLARRRSILSIAYLSGIRKSMLEYVESGRRCLSLEYAYHLSIALRVSLDDLVGPPIIIKPRARAKRGTNILPDGRVYPKLKHPKAKKILAPVSDKKIVIGTQQAVGNGDRYPSRKKQRP